MKRIFPDRTNMTGFLKPTNIWWTCTNSYFGWTSDQLESALNSIHGKMNIFPKTGWLAVDSGSWMLEICLSEQTFNALKMALRYCHKSSWMIFMNMSKLSNCKVLQLRQKFLKQTYNLKVRILPNILQTTYQNKFVKKRIAKYAKQI